MEAVAQAGRGAVAGAHEEEEEEEEGGGEAGTSAAAGEARAAERRAGRGMGLSASGETLEKF